MANHEGHLFMSRLLSKAEYNSQWLAELFAGGAETSAVAEAWNECSDLWTTEAALKWLHSAGGLQMEIPQNEFELLSIADTAPNSLLFGLAHGRLADLLANPTMNHLPHRFQMVSGEVNKIHEYLSRRVLDRGYAMMVSAEETGPDYFDNLPMGTSGIPMNDLVHMAVNAPEPFMLGQVTSWIMASNRIKTPDAFMDTSIPCRRKVLRDYFMVPGVNPTDGVSASL